METSGATRDALKALGVNAMSADTLPTVSPGRHRVGDVFDVIERDPQPPHHRWGAGLFHPTCTFHVVSAAWAFSDPDFDRYPGVGYHQRVKPETKTGAERRAARDAAEADLERIRLAPIPLKVVENPRGTISTRLPAYGKPCDVVQPYEFGSDASKATCLWAFDYVGQKVPFHLPRDPAQFVKPRMVCSTCKGISAYDAAFFGGCQHCGAEAGLLKPRWGNQTDSGQNNESPGADRWSVRSETYPGIAAALAKFIANAVRPQWTP